MEEIGAGLGTELHEKIEVAAPRLEITAGGRSEELESRDAVLPTQQLNRRSILINQGNHGQSWATILADAKINS